MDKIISVPGSKYALAESHRGLIVLFEDGQCLVAKDHVRDDYVKSYLIKASAIFGKTIRATPTEMKDLNQYANAGLSDDGNGGEVIQTSDMEKIAQDFFKRAVEMKASDIHIRVQDKLCNVLFRVNSELTPIRDFPAATGHALVKAIYTSLTDVSDTNFKENARQGARISEASKLPHGLFGLRVEKAPAVGGVVMVLRLLYAYENGGTLADLGYLPQQCDQIEMMMQQPFGINIISGPTGSGKSTTLQRVLSDLFRMHEGRSHIITVEDPPEYLIEGAVQTPVMAESEERRGEAFRAAIASIMRLDPDIIMIGEMRDLASAKLGIQAAMTGHQVWTTLHANNAMAIIDRLVDLGIPLTTITDPTLITGLVAQRLVKALCPHCRITFKEAVEKNLVSRSLKARVEYATKFNTAGIYCRGPGCPECEHKSIKGRVAVAEVINPDVKLFELIGKGDRQGAIDYWIKEQRGMNMRSVAILAVINGQVDPLDAERVVGPLTMDIINDDNSMTVSEISALVSGTGDKPGSIENSKSTEPLMEVA